MKKVWMIAVACVALSLAGTITAGDWPPNRITAVWHSSAGSAGDIMMRAIGRFLEKKHNIVVVVENWTGASGANSWNRTARGPADGTILQGVSSTFIASPLQNNMGISYRDFDPIAMLFIDGVCLFVSADSQYQTLEDFIADAKKRPGELSFTGGTAGNTEFVAARKFMAEAGVNVPVVPFDGGSEGVVAVLGGHVTAGVGEYSEVQAAAEGGKIRVLAMFNKVPGIDIPSLQDLGYKTTVEKFRGIVVKKGTPQPIKDAIFASLQEMMQDPDFITYYTTNTLIPSFLPGDEFYKVMERQEEELKESLAGM